MTKQRIAKSSINFKPVKSFSESHNLRKREMPHIYSDLTENNESWSGDRIASRRSEIEELYQAQVKQRMQAKSTPIKEAVLNLLPHHTMNDIHCLRHKLKDKFGIDCFQAYIHKDEGKSKEDLNYHAHLLFDWQNKETGRTFKLNRFKMVEIQTLVAETLEMERGKEGSKAVRLEAQAYKAEQKRKDEEKHLTEALKKKDLVEQYDLSPKELGKLWSWRESIREQKQKWKRFLEEKKKNWQEKLNTLRKIYQPYLKLWNNNEKRLESLKLKLKSLKGARLQQDQISRLERFERRR